MEFTAVILAAGKGVRMRSELPKVAHPVAGRPMILHVLQAVRAAGVKKVVVVVGHERQVVQDILAGQDVDFAIQEKQLGTGHALMQAEGFIDQDNHLLVLAGDTPLLREATLGSLMDLHRQKQASATLLSTIMTDPYGYGRVLRGSRGEFARIVEEKDSNEEEKRVQEINSGIYCLDAREAFLALASIDTENAQGEYYLTDVLSILKSREQSVEVFLNPCEQDILGVNDRIQLSVVDKIMRNRIHEKLINQGVVIRDPATTFIDADVEVGLDTIILPFTIIEGATRIGCACEIGPSTRISDSLVGDQTIIESSRVNKAQIGPRCTIGPFAYLRPEAVLDEGVKVGDFVEIKKSYIGAHSKVPHLSYVGDAQVGCHVNIGAGTITCNYDGIHKYPTILEDGVFIGSNTNLVAPIRVGKDSVTGAGSSLSRDVPPDTLAVERAPQKHIPNWSKRKKREDS
ncbi:MAG TPA: bifunctional UDP-N-acetylglucosamine diphosphorylase/glucosamine-1-phosphate N-acetyltransferase GlmU [Syntrophomonadaceae bacterium]|nr:bifunctional UDP-N-acetylglucosamine diphosphorylase/glucosamine-1-phosphate N-acetyltransferase GlmU [Syntrophomonadaceae bacterium]